MVRIGLKKSLIIAAFSLLSLGLVAKISGNTQPSFPKDQQTGKTTNGAVQGANLGLPKALPDDLPLYPSATVVSSTSSVDQSQVSLLVEENVDQVKDFYSINLIKNGWKSVGRSRYTRNSEVLELDFIPRLEKQSLVILVYSPVPTK